VERQRRLVALDGEGQPLEPFGPPKSARSRRTVALDAIIVDAPREHRDAQLLERSRR
jgi:hypothetical protein